MPCPRVAVVFVGTTEKWRPPCNPAQVFARDRPLPHSVRPFGAQCTFIFCEANFNLCLRKYCVTRISIFDDVLWPRKHLVALISVPAK